MIWKVDARRVPATCACRYRAGVPVARPLLFLDVDGTLLPFGGPEMLSVCTARTWASRCRGAGIQLKRRIAGARARPVQALSEESRR
jgi:hypothetical protein